MFVKERDLFLMKADKRRGAKMTNREWTEEQKFNIVLEGLRSVILGTVVPKSTIFRRPILQKYITNPLTIVQYQKARKNE